MKRVQLLLCVCMLLVLTSCNQTSLPLPEDLTDMQTSTADPNNPNSYENPIENTQFEPAALYQYFLLHGVPARFNVTTGEVTYLCDDPLCSHDADSDCLFAASPPLNNTLHRQTALSSGHPLLCTGKLVTGSWNVF